MATERDTQVKEVVDSVARKTANEAAAMVRKLVARVERQFGVDIDGDGKAGGVKLTALIGIAMIFVASTLCVLAEGTSWSPFDDTYGTATIAGDSDTQLTVITADSLVGDVTGDITGDVAGAVAATTLSASSNLTLTVTTASGSATALMTNAPAITEETPIWIDVIVGTNTYVLPAWLKD